MSAQIKDGGQAFPCFKPEGPMMQDGGPEWPAEVITGMTLRDYFAAKAMLGLMEAAFEEDGRTFEETAKAVSECAFRVADAMLAAREVQS